MVKEFQQESFGTMVVLAEQAIISLQLITNEGGKIWVEFLTHILLAHQEDTKSNRKHLA